MNGYELNSLEIISETGLARSFYIDAINAAKKGNFEESENLLKIGEKHFVLGHTAHTKLVQKEAAGEPILINILLSHAQDMLMSAETFKLIALEIIELHKQLQSFK